MFVKRILRDTQANEIKENLFMDPYLNDPVHSHIQFEIFVHVLTFSIYLLCTDECKFNLFYF